jgi:hypothetical protein
MKFIGELLANYFMPMPSNSILMSIALGLAELIVMYLWRKSGDHSQKKWYKLFRTEFGPRTDVGNMSRKEIYRSARRFMFWAFHFTFLLSIIVAVMCHYYDSPEQVPLLLIALAMSILPLIIMVFFIFGSYLFIRGFFRRESYDMRLENVKNECCESDGTEIGEGN